MLVAGLILLKTSFSSLTLKVIFLLKTSILEWAVDKNGRPRIKGTSSSSAKVPQSSWERDYFRQNAHVLRARYGILTTSNTALPNPLSCKTLLICPIRISKVLIKAPWFLIAASVEAQISLIMFEFSSCLLADSAMNFVSDSSRLGLRSGHEEFLLFCW
ncbi:hypothetical protein Tco_0606081 [Tanacetum coccineum]